MKTSQEIYAPADVRIPRRLSGGYDNAHGFSHRHFKGDVTAEPFPGYEVLYERFEAEWQQMAMAFVNEGKT